VSTRSTTIKAEPIRSAHGVLSRSQPLIEDSGLFRVIVRSCITPFEILASRSGREAAIRDLSSFFGN